MLTLRPTIRHWSRRVTRVFTVFIFSFFLQPHAYAVEVQPNIVEKLGQQMDFSGLEFVDESGKTVQLSSYFEQDLPVILNFVYFRCPSICNVLLNSVVDEFQKLDMEVGKHFRVLTISINPSEDAKLARGKKAAYLKALGKPIAPGGWKFLTGEKAAIKKVTDLVGFVYRFDRLKQEYAHPAGLFVLTPGGRISRILYGISFKARDIKLSVLEAGSGKIGSIIDRVILFCYQYDPASRKYSLVLTNVLRAVSTVLLLFVLTTYGFFWLRRRRRRNP